MSKIKYILDKINEVGYFDGLKLTTLEYKMLSDIVRKDYQEKISASGIAEIKLEEYLKIQGKIDHENYWGKKNRCITKNDVSKIKSMNFYSDILKGIGNFTISDEENLGYGNIYYRLVRPNERGDIGTMHADSWFWEMNKINSSRRIKIWIPLITGYQDAFCYVPGSHKDGVYKYEIVERNGQNKPKIIGDISQDKLRKFGSMKCSAILFDDNLIHGGLEISDSIRVSIEFTMLLEIK